MNADDVSQDIKSLDEMLKKVLLDKKSTIDKVSLSNQKLILYGAGDLGMMAIELLATVGISPSYIVDKNANKQGTYINGIKIVSPNDICEDDLENTVFIVCVVKLPYGDFEKYLKLIGCKKDYTFL